MTDLALFIDNVIERKRREIYTAIVGANPSKGARSPKLWNAAFAALGRASKMLPLDVTSAKLPHLLDVLEGDLNFLGGAVAVPHKERIATWLNGRLVPEAAMIGSVNCLFRRDGRLWGANTDGEAARASLERAAGSLTDRTILLLGLGGAGKAVAAFLAGRCEALILSGRDAHSVARYADRVGAKWVHWNEIGSILPAIDILVNCTSVGSMAAASAAESPLDPATLGLLSSGAFVFDIIYDPSPTPLLASAMARGLATFDGSDMNLEQAVLAFCRTIPGSDPIAVRSAMELARHGAPRLE